MMLHYDNFALRVFPYEKYLHRVINFSESYTFFIIDVTFLSGLALVVMGVAIIVVMVVLWENTESIQTQHVRIFLVLYKLRLGYYFYQNDTIVCGAFILNHLSPMSSFISLLSNRSLEGIEKKGSTELYPGLSQTSKMERFATIVNGF